MIFSAAGRGEDEEEEQAQQQAQQAPAPPPIILLSMVGDHAEIDCAVQALLERLPHTSGIEDIERTRTELLALRAQAHREYMALPAPASDAPSGPLRQLMALAAQNRKRALAILQGHCWRPLGWRPWMSACEVRVLRAAALGHMPIGSDRSSRASCGVGAALCADPQSDPKRGARCVLVRYACYLRPCSSPCVCTL